MRTLRIGDWARVIGGPPDERIGETVLLVSRAGSGRAPDEVCAATVEGELLWLRERQLETAWECAGGLPDGSEA